MLKTYLSRLLRISGLIIFSDKLHFVYQLVKNRRNNHSFKKANPEFILPPNYILYEAYQMDHSKYYNDGLNTAKWLCDQLTRHIELNNLKILDWGCGPGRISRHLPTILDKSCAVYGTDYNKTTINWCKKNLTNIHFSDNELVPPLNYSEGEFDVVYGISIFTHLSKEMHFAWIDELSRILKKGGILFITTQTEVFRMKLSSIELEQFDKGNLIIRGKTKEGHRTFSAFQPEMFMRNLFTDFDVLDHIKGELKNNKPQQDTWIVKKR